MIGGRRIGVSRGVARRACCSPGSASAGRSTRSSPASSSTSAPLGITNFLFLRVLSKNTELNTPSRRSSRSSSRCSRDIPVLGPILFDGTPYLYFTLIVMVFFTYMLFRTRWGLRLRASGEKPSAAGTVGIDVIRIRYRSLIMAGDPGRDRGLVPQPLDAPAASRWR